MDKMVTTTDGLVALVVLVIFPLLLIAFSWWVELRKIVGTREHNVEVEIAQAVQTLLLVVLLSALPSLINGLSSIIQIGFRPDGGGWFVYPNLTFIVAPLAWLSVAFLIVRRVLILNLWLKIARG